MATLGQHEKKHKVTVVGSGNWGSAIAKICAENTREHPEIFEEEVRMCAYQAPALQRYANEGQGVYEEELTVPQTSKHYDPQSSFSTQKHKLTVLINHLVSLLRYRNLDRPNISLIA